jgi:LysM repeat protein
MLKTAQRQFYQVKQGQSLVQIADFFSVSAFLIAQVNHLTAPPFVGQILRIPQEQGNAYVVCEGDTKALLCGDEETFLKKNGTDVFYIGMRVIL